MARTLFLAVLSLAFAAILAWQAASLVLSKKNPELALTLMPSNRAAQQAVLQRALAQGVAKQRPPSTVARELEPAARRAFAADPLGAASLSIAILAARDPLHRSARLDASLRINRRDLILQSTHLQEALAAKDFGLTFATIDRILRAHPEQQERIYPVIDQALEQSEARRVLAGLLDGSSDWHADYLEQAIKQPEHVLALAELRLSGTTTSSEFDRALLRGLAKASELEIAARIYARASPQPASVSNSGRLGWATQLPPFDWRLTDERGLRAQPDLTGEVLEVSIQPGKGGLLAERVVERIAPRFQVVVEHHIGPPSQLHDMRIELRCAGYQAPLAVQRFDRGPMRLEVARLDPECRFVWLQIYARAWSDQSRLSGTIDRITIERAAAHTR